MLLITLFPFAILLGIPLALPLIAIYFAIKYFLRERSRFGLSKEKPLISKVEIFGMFLSLILVGLFLLIFLTQTP